MTTSLAFRRIDPGRDAGLVVANHRDACIASFGSDARFRGAAHYLRWLAARCEEYPDGHLLAFLGDECVGQLELQVPYGLASGYVNLFYIAPSFRRQGFGRILNRRCEEYFRSWEASRIELHVSTTNERAIGFYRKMGYKLARVEPRRTRTWLMAKTLALPAPVTDNSI